jgi:hypothetical protein
MPATYSEILSILNSDKFDDSDKWVVRWQYNMLDEEFDLPLARLIVVADLDNLAKLGRGFPVEVAGFRRWAHGDLGTRLREAGLNI